MRRSRRGRRREREQGLVADNWNIKALLSGRGSQLVLAVLAVVVTQIGVQGAGDKHHRRGRDCSSLCKARDEAPILRGDLPINLLGVGPRPNVGQLVLNSHGDFRPFRCVAQDGFHCGPARRLGVRASMLGHSGEEHRVGKELGRWRENLEDLRR